MIEILGIFTRHFSNLNHCKAFFHGCSLRDFVFSKNDENTNMLHPNLQEGMGINIKYLPWWLPEQIM